MIRANLFLRKGRLSRQYEKYRTLTPLRYAITKLLEIYYVRELASKIDPNKTGVVVNLINPGLCWSELDRGLNFALRAMTNFLRLLLARTTEVGGRTLVHAASSGIESHGKYSLDCRFSE